MLEISSVLAGRLEHAADVLVPLTKWIGTRPAPPPQAVPVPMPLPWRDPATPLNAKRLGVVAFLKSLFAETSSDADLVAYFASRAEAPLALAPFDDTANWRQQRGLSSDPTFGVVESENVLTDVDGHPISREGFYALYLPLFDAACTDAENAAMAGDVRAIDTSLGTSTVSDIPGLLSDLQAAPNVPVTDYIRIEMSRVRAQPSSRQGETTLAAYDKAVARPSDQQSINAFLRAMSRLMRDRLLYDPATAEQVAFSQWTKDRLALASSYKGWDLQAFNWLFLNDVYPGRLQASKALEWSKFVEQLWNDESPFWPKLLGRKSSVFLRQLGRDVLYAMLGMRNPIPPPWDVAVLIELGEQRRVGNRFGSADAEAATRSFRKKFDEDMQNGLGAPTRPMRGGFPAFGAPPVGPMEQQV